MNKKAIELLDKGIEEIYNSLLEKPFKILDIFNDFFGEENVDMQGHISLDNFKTTIKGTSIGVYLSMGSGIIPLDKYKLYKSKTIIELIDCPDIDIMATLPDILKTIKVFFCSFIYNSNIYNRIFILVHFPHVRVTNENDKYVDINHLWAKININIKGELIGSFGLNRSEYPLSHFKSDYLHSHVSYIPTSNFTHFQTPCTGRGPINNTIASLNRDYDEDIWNMFCLELSKYVTVESIEGIPYRYLEKIGNGNIMVDTFTTYFIWNNHHNFPISSFIKYFISTKKLKFNYVNGSYSIGMSLSEYLIVISNEFIKWYNYQFNTKNVKDFVEDLLREDIITRCIIKDNKIFREDTSSDDDNYTQYIGKKVCTFKGKDITINIVDTDSINDNISIILDPQIALYLLRIILEVLNYRYGRDKNTTEDSQSDTEVRYL